MEARNISCDNVVIVFEKANIDYDKMKNLILTCQRNPIHQKTKYLMKINVNQIYVKKKREEPLLQIADLVAHSLYKCVDKSENNFGIVEPRYIRELSSRFFWNPEDDKIIGAGIFCVHSIKHLELDPDAEEIISNMKSTPYKSSLKK